MKKFLYRFLQNPYKNTLKGICIAVFAVLICLLVLNQVPLSFAVNKFNGLAKHGLQVYYIDVGQASATFVVMPNNETMLIDAGTEESASELVKSISWILHKNKLKVINHFLMTHSDADHVGGAVAVLKKFEVKKAYRPKVLSSSEKHSQYSYQTVYTNAYNNTIKMLYSEPDCVITFVDNLHTTFGKDFSLDIYACKKEYYSETNAYSPFIVMEYAGKSFMFTGDATSAREREFLADLDGQLQVDFLQVAHHGSKYSSTNAFLQAVNPKLAIISAGDDIHPAQEVISRLENLGVKDVCVTKEVGTIGIAVNANGSFYVCVCNIFLDFPLMCVCLFLACCVILVLIDLKSPKIFYAKKWQQHQKCL